MRQSSPAQQAIVAATFSLLAFGGCVAAFLPPLVDRTTASMPLTVMLGIALAVSFVLHLAFIGIAAQRLGRSVVAWVVLAFLFFPIASIVGLVLFEWFSDEQRQQSLGQTAR